MLNMLRVLIFNVLLARTYEFNNVYGCRSQFVAFVSAAQAERELDLTYCRVYAQSLRNEK